MSAPQWEKIEPPGGPDGIAGILKGAIHEVQTALSRRAADLVNLANMLAVAQDQRRELEKAMNDDVERP